MGPGSGSEAAAGLHAYRVEAVKRMVTLEDFGPKPDAAGR